MAQICGLSHAACYWVAALLGIPLGLLSGPAQYLASQHHFRERTRWLRRDEVD